MRKLLSFALAAVLAAATLSAQQTVRPSAETAASAPNSDDYILIDGATYGVRALPAAFYLNAGNINAGTLSLSRLSTGSGTNGQVLELVGGVWTPTTPPGGGNVSTSGTITSGYLAVWNGSTTVYASQYLPSTNMPALGGDVSTSAGSTSTTVNNIQGHAVNLAGAFTLSGAYSFTGTLTGTTAVTFPTSGTLLANPMTTTGDIIVAGSGGVPTRAALGSNGTFWGVSGGVAGYYSLPGGGNVSTSGTITSGYLPIWNSSTTISASQYLPSGNFPTLTGDITTTAGSTTTTLKLTGPGAVGPIGSTTTVPVISIDANGRVTALTSATIASGGGLPSGGTTYQRLAKNSTTNYDVGWYSEPWFFVSDYSSLQAAFTAAANAHGTLILPAGTTALPSGGLVLPAGFTGHVGIHGLGMGVSILQQSNSGSDGLHFDLSTGGSSSNLNTVDIADLTVQSSGTNGGKAIWINYGTTAQGSVESHAGTTVTNVQINGGQWSSGLYCVQAWHLFVNGLYASGDLTGSYYYVSSGTGPGQGSAVYLDSCVNDTLENLQLEWWYNGVCIPTGTVLVSQGVQISNYEAVECMQMINSQGTIYLTNFLFDDGNSTPRSSGGHQVTPIFIQSTNSNGSYIGNGQILANTGVAQIELSGTNDTKIVGVDFEYTTSCPKSIWATASAAGGSVTNCSFGGSTGVTCDSGTSGFIAKGNIAQSAVDNGSNSLGDVYGTTNVFTVPSSPGTAFYISCPIASAGLGKKPTSVAAQCVDDPTYQVQYDYNAVGGTSTATTVYLKVTQFSGGSMSSWVGNNHRYNVVVTP